MDGLYELVIGHKNRDKIRSYFVFSVTAAAISFLIAVISLGLYMAKSNFLIIFEAVIFFIAGLIFFFIRNKKNYDIEYSFFDNELNIAKVINNKKRKELYSLKMSNISLFRENGHKDIMKYMNDNTCRKVSLVLNDNAPYVYCALVRRDDDTLLIMELDHDLPPLIAKAMK